MKKKYLGSTKSTVHGKKKEIICHDMRKYVWYINKEIWKKDSNKKNSKKKKRP